MFLLRYGRLILLFIELPRGSTIGQDLFTWTGGLMVWKSPTSSEQPPQLYHLSKVKKNSLSFTNRQTNMLGICRITPFLPNWFINIVSPVIDVPLGPFWLGTFVGVAPPSFVAIQVRKIQKLKTIQPKSMLHFPCSRPERLFSKWLPRLRLWHSNRWPCWSLLLSWALFPWSSGTGKKTFFQLLYVSGMKSARFIFIRMTPGGQWPRQYVWNFLERW